MQHLLLVISCFQAWLVRSAPATPEHDMVAQISKILGMPKVTFLQENMSNPFRQEIDDQSDVESKAHANFLARGDDGNWSHFTKDFTDKSSSSKKTKPDPHLVHLPVPRGNGSAFDLQIEKDTMCSTTRFSLALTPGSDPTKPWTVQANQTYGDVSKRLSNANPKDITKNSKIFMDTVLWLARPIFGHISRDSQCKEAFPMPKRRDASHLNFLNERDDVEDILEAARSYILNRVATARLIYIGYGLAATYNIGQVIGYGGQVFVGDMDQGHPDITAARRRVHAYGITMASYVILEQVQKALGYDMLGDVICTKLIHPLVNVLFDNLQALYRGIKGDNGQEVTLGIQKRDDISACCNVNDFKYVINNIGQATKSIADSPNANEKAGCSHPKK